MGGLSKKSAFITSIRANNNTPVLLLDAGNMLFRQHTLPVAAGEAEAARIKAKGLVVANQQIGLSFSGIGANDLAAGPGFLKSTSDKGFTWLSLNLIDLHSSQPIFPGYTKVQTNGLSVAVLAVTNHENAAAASDASYRVRPWQELLPALVAQLRSEADMLILLSNYPLSENREIARSCPELDMIFQSGYAMGNLPPLVAGNALISQTEIRGRYLGLLEIDWQGHGDWQQRARGAVSEGKSAGSVFNQRFIPLNAAIPDDPVMDALVQRIEQQAQAAAR